MSVDLNFWKYKEGVTHNDSQVYKTACCDGEIFDGLEDLPIDEIIGTVSSAFSSWNSIDKYNYEKGGGGGVHSRFFLLPRLSGLTVMACLNLI